MLPAYQQWLESESAFELPIDARAMMQAATKPYLPQAPEPIPAAPKAGPASKPSKPKNLTEAKPLATTRAEAIPKIQGHLALPTPRWPDEINVELVPLPTAQEEDAPRSALELNRRDFVLLGVGSLGVLLAMGAGYGLSRAVRRKMPEDETDAESTGK